MNPLFKQINSNEELEETSKLMLLLRGQKIRTLTQSQIQQLCETFGAKWEREDSFEFGVLGDPRQLKATQNSKPKHKAQNPKLQT